MSFLLRKLNVGFVDSEPCGAEGAPNNADAALEDWVLDGAPKDMLDPGFQVASTAEPLLLVGTKGFAKGLNVAGFSEAATVLFDCCFCGSLSSFSSVSSSEPMNNESFSTLCGGDSSLSISISTIPCAFAWATVMPLMTAGRVLPYRFFSTRLSEYTCFRRARESIGRVSSIA